MNGFAATMTQQQAQKLAGTAGVAFVVPDELRQPTTDASGDFLGLSGPYGPWANGLTGEDVVIGVIDTGIWPEHPSVADDGSYGPSPLDLTEVTDADGNVYPACDFGGDETHLAPGLTDAPFACNGKLIGARHMMPTYLALTGLSDVEYDSARDEDGHGTHTATTAVGNADVPAEVLGIDRGLVTGIAPRAASSRTRHSENSVATAPISRVPSTRPSPTASTSSTTPSGRARSRSVPTTWRSCSPRSTASASRPRTATPALVPRRSVRRHRCRG